MSFLFIFKEPSSTEEESSNLGSVDLFKQRREMSKKRKLCLVQTVSTNNYYSSHNHISCVAHVVIVSLISWESNLWKN